MEATVEGVRYVTGEEWEGYCKAGEGRQDTVLNLGDFENNKEKWTQTEIKCLTGGKD